MVGVWMVSGFNALPLDNFHQHFAWGWKHKILRRYVFAMHLHCKGEYIYKKLLGSLNFLCSGPIRNLGEEKY